MFQRILVPLDGSEQAQQALPMAMRLAQVSHGTVVVLRVVHVQSQTSYGLSSSLPSAALQTRLEVERSEALRYLHEVTTDPAYSQVHCELMVEVGPIASTLLRCAAEQRCDLLVLSRQGHGASPRWPLGSVAEKVLHHITLPVFLLHGSAMTQDLQALVALDGSAHAEVAVPIAAQLVSELSSGGGLTLFHILRMPEESAQNGPLHDYLVRDGQNYLAQTAERLRQSRQYERNFTTTWTLLQGEDTAQTVLDALERRSRSEEGELAEPYNVLVMTTRGRGNAELGMLGSITERLLRSSHCSLLLVEPQWQLATPERQASIAAQFTAKLGYTGA